MIPYIEFTLMMVWLIAFCIAIYYTTKDKSKRWKTPKIKDGVPTKYGWCVRHPENLILGENTDIGFGTYIQAKHGVHIGKNVQIGAHCAIYSRNTIDDTKSRIHIEDNVKIGAGTIILPRTDGKDSSYYIIIGENSIIGALSLVKQSIPSNSTYAGVPAKPINIGKSATEILEENYMK